jgi:hypothetical protein
MRIALLAALAAAASISAAQAEDLVATRPGLMCQSTAALARLTLPGGDSRTHLPHPAAADQQLADTGGCYDLWLGERVTVIEAFHNTSIVVTGTEDPTHRVIPNIDFEPADATGPAPRSTEPGAAIPAGYRAVQRVPVGGRASDTLVVLLDRRLTADLRKEMWHKTSDVSMALDPKDPRQAVFQRRPVLNAQLRLVSPEGTVLDELETSYPLAEVRTAPIHGLPYPVFQFSVDESAASGGFSGPATLLLTPASTQLRPMAFVPDGDQRPETLVLIEAERDVWAVAPAPQGGPGEIEEAFCPAASAPHLLLFTYRFRGGRWHQARRIGDACNVIEAMPPRTAFP